VFRLGNSGMSAISVSTQFWERPRRFLLPSLASWAEFWLEYEIDYGGARVPRTEHTLYSFGGRKISKYCAQNLKLVLVLAVVLILQSEGRYYRQQRQQYFCYQLFKPFLTMNSDDFRLPLNSLYKSHGHWHHHGCRRLCWRRHHRHWRHRHHHRRHHNCRHQ